MATDFLADLTARGLIHQQTDEPALRAHLAGGVRSAYVGFDPTADSLTIGNLVGIMALLRWQRAGHRPIALMGGGTGLIGDPSGKSAERQLLTPERVAANVDSIKTIFDRLLDQTPPHTPHPGRPNAGTIVNNISWLGSLSYLDALRDIGKHFSVNQMIQRDSVRDRLNNREQGISYTEFSYMLLQAYDFAHLHRHQGVTLQMGGSDQWGNIVSGSDLIRRLARGGQEAAEGAEAPAAFGLTWPLVTKTDGTKFGKTESGAIWLTAPRGPGDHSPARTSAYAYYQFWLNAADADAERFLKTFTLLSTDEIAGLMVEQAANPGGRPAQRALARAATDLLHGEAVRTQAEQAAAALFSGEIAGLALDTLTEVFAALPTTEHAKAGLGGDGLSVLDLLAQTPLVQSKGQAKQALQEGSVSVNGRKVGPADRVGVGDLLHGQIIALRRGKKSWHITRWA